MDQANALTYQSGDYIFKMYDKIEHLFLIQKGLVEYINPEKLEIVQHIHQHCCEGLREIYVRFPKDKTKISEQDDYLFIEKGRFLSFINEDKYLRDFFIKEINDKKGIVKSN